MHARGRQLVPWLSNFEGTSMRKARSVIIWAVVSLCLIVLITLPVNLQTQLITSITVVTVMAVIKVLKGEGDVAPRGACLRHFDRAALCLLAHHQYAAAYEPA